MSFVANPFVVVLDANVLFPFRVRDVLLTFTQEGLFRARVTDEILDEWTRNLIRLKPHLEKSVRQQEAVIRSTFEECFVTGHQPLMAGLKLPDPDDRHVLAAAIRCSAQVIVTENHKDFPSEVLDEYGVERLGADDMLANTYDLFPSGGARALRRVRKRYDNPAMSPSEFLLDLTRHGLSKLAAQARADIEYL
ncbi:PIN domain-containing protein [uncultured Roseobacter sp.]|uniref:PIN domain-containing protein n=1 Tax=uncultured Roseobacter sp. TaxID=114847 RepID=UPI002620838D|nr:PIN domain-containing protein [uncultured Roseobacter sp.]